MDKKEVKYEIQELDKKSGSNKVFQVVISILIIIAVIVGLIFAILNFVDLDSLFTQTVNYKTEKEVTITDKGIADAVDKLYDATVIVEVGTKDKISGWGSGFVYKTDDKYGYILTNAHVVESATKILIDNSKEEEIDGEVVGYDTYSDVAVVKIPAEKVISVAELGNTEDIRLGDTVFAIGTPVSLQYSFTVTRGILSGKNRMVSMSSTSGNAFYGQQVVDSWYMSLLQIDASINSGNSGGPLANSNGEVIGITNSKLSNSYMNSASIENMGFAIPIEDALAVANQLEENGKVTRAVLGVSMTTVEAAKATGYDLDDDVTYGAVVADISKGSSADKADLQKGDVIIKINDYKVENYMYLKYYLYRFNVGDTVTLTYIRDGKEKTVDITLKN